MEPRPLRKDAERNRARILEAADAVFAAEGLGATLEGIAEKADVSIGTLYRLFPTRAALIEDLFEEKVDQVLAWAAEGLDHPDPWEGFTGYLWNAAAFHAADRGLTEVLMGSELVREKIVETRERIAPVVTRLVERAKESGRLRPDFAPQDVPVLLFMVSAAARRAPGSWHRYLEIMIEGLQGAEPLSVPPPALDELVGGINRC
ncbi:TetR/AcrR family transcriptional regulator [Actinocorallia lasiicapitis]